MGGMGPDPERIFETNQKYGMVTQAWSPLGNGVGIDSRILTDPVTIRIAGYLQVDPTQVALKWIKEHGASLVLQADPSKQKQVYTDAFGLHFTLSRQDMADLDSLNFSDDHPSSVCTNSNSHEILVQK